MIMQALEPAREPKEESLTFLRLPAANGMLRGMLVLHVPPRAHVDSASLLTDANDATIDEFVAELRALGGMAVIA